MDTRRNLFHWRSVGTRCNAYLREAFHEGFSADAQSLPIPLTDKSDPGRWPTLDLHDTSAGYYKIRVPEEGAEDPFAAGLTVPARWIRGEVPAPEPSWRRVQDLKYFHEALYILLARKYGRGRADEMWSIGQNFGGFSAYAEMLYDVDIPPGFDKRNPGDMNDPSTWP